MSNFKQLTREQLLRIDLAKVKYGEELVELEGVVSESGQGGWESAGHKIHCFSFEAWRRPGQAIVKQQLTILRPIKSHAERYSQDYPSLSLQRFQFLLSVDGTRAILAALANEPANPDGLQEIAEELARPVILKTEHFGELVLNRRIDQFEGSAEWNGDRVDISFDPEAGHDISRGLQVAETLWKDQQTWKQRIEDYAVEELLPTKNDYWLGEDEDEGDVTPLTPEQFQARMTLEAITFDREGGFEFWHDDGDLFYGHSIQIGGTLEGLTRADIPG